MSTPSEENRSFLDSKPERCSYRAPRWTVGLKTPLTIIICYLLAAGIAVGHLFYCRYLDGKLVSETVSQTWNNAINTAFVRLFSWMVAGAAGASFTQLLWHYLRVKPTKISTIDSLFTLASTPLNLVNLDNLLYSPVLWLFGALFPLISVATTFPPGALIVGAISSIRSGPIDITALDAAYRGNGTMVDLWENAMFLTGSDGEYRSPSAWLSSLATRTLLNASYLTTPSPCGANCSYDAQFVGPTFECQPGAFDLDILASVAFTYYSNSSSSIETHSAWSADGLNYLAVDHPTDQLTLDQVNNTYSFDIAWRNDSSSVVQSMRCTTYVSVYSAKISFVNFRQQVDVSVGNSSLLNAALLSSRALFYDLQNSPEARAGEVLPASFHSYALNTSVDTTETFLLCNVLAMKDSLIQVLGGAISAYGSENQLVSNTLIAQSPLASFSYDSGYSKLDLDITPALIEGLMRNMTISGYLNGANHFNPIVQQTVFETGYLFVHWQNLLAYPAALLASLGFIVAGVIALFRNGVAADQSFVQVLCTTTSSDLLMNRLAKQACLGGSASLPEELKSLVVRFGEVRKRWQRYGDDEGVRVAAFGTIEETKKMRRGTKLM